MYIEQCQLPLFDVGKNRSVAFCRQESRPRSIQKPKFLTTNQVVQFLGLSDPYPLYKAKQGGCAYRLDAYIVVPIKRNQWEIFERRSA
jgi:hypothetical protein